MLKDKITEVALNIGFNDIKFIEAKPLLQSEQHFLEWRNKGYAADMNYLLKDNPIHARPEYLLENAKTIIMLTANYHSPCPPRPSPEHGRIASYAVGLDYHKVLRSKIQDLVNHPDLKDVFAKSKFFTDAVPLLEKSFAKKAGLGFRGRNTLLISRKTGSFNFISELITDLDIETRHPEEREARREDPDEPLTSPIPQTKITCGNCTRCMDICPTGALPQEYQLDARKCISYHTIENRNEIPQDLASKFGEWFFGCDLCQTICPYNRKSSQGFKEFSPEAGFGHWFYLPEILDLELAKHPNKNSLISALEKHKFIDVQALPSIKIFLKKQDDLNDDVLDHIFQIKFARTPLLRPKRKGLIRNAKIILANFKQT